jgi:simple sugar transport system ATP-binding protein
MYELQAIDCHFGAIRALNSVNFRVAPGEVVALLGDNGAGKSTLLQIMAGARRPSGGIILRDGRRVEFHSPRDAARAGVHMVYQDLALVDAIDIAANMALGREPLRRGPLGWCGVLNKKVMRRDAVHQLSALGISTVDSVSRPVETLSGGQRQAIALARAALRIAADKAAVLLLDEPTAALGYQQSREVERLISGVADTGVGVVLVTHDIPLSFRVADRVAILNRGKKVADVDTGKTDQEAVLGWMTGARAPQEALR